MARKGVISSGAHPVTEHLRLTVIAGMVEREFTRELQRLARMGEARNRGCIVKGLIEQERIVRLLAEALRPLRESGTLRFKTSRVGAAALRRARRARDQTAVVRMDRG